MLGNFFGGLTPKEKGLLASIQELSMNGEINGRKKLMKLMFFLEHYDFDSNSITPDHKFCDNEFMIYKYGPFSFDVMNTLDKLKNDGYIEEKSSGFPDTIKISLSKKGMKELTSVQLDNTKKIQLSKVKSEFSSRPGYDLENLSLELLHISKENKHEFMGLPISVLVSEGI